MDISKDHYESHFLDYHEGRLSAAAQQAVLDFLARHPELRQVFDDYEAVCLEAGTAPVFPAKEQLKRGEVRPENRDYYFAAYVEGDLDEAEASAVEALADQNPQMARELALMKKTRLPVDEEVVFAGKSGLKRLEIAPEAVEASPAATQARPLSRIRHWYYPVAAAAVVFIMAGLFFTRAPENQLMQYAHDLPAVGDAELPEAVAAVPASREEGLPLAEGQPQALEARPISTSPSPVAPAPAQVRPGMPGRMQQIRPGALPTAQIPSQASVEARSQFAYWHLRHRDTEGPALAEASPETAPTPTDRGLVAQAANRLQQGSILDVDDLDRRLTNTRGSLGAYAGQGIANLGAYAWERLGIQSRRDEEGRLRKLAIGDFLAISR